MNTNLIPQTPKKLVCLKVVDPGPTTFAQFPQSKLTDLRLHAQKKFSFKKHFVSL